MTKKIPYRQCIGCGAHKEKSQLIRIVFSSDSVQIDWEQKKNGRGLYLCKDNVCIQNAKKKKKLERMSQKNQKIEWIYTQLEREIYQIEK